MPERCPCCNGTLLNEFVYGKSRRESLKKSCQKKIDHTFIVVSEDESAILDNPEINFHDTVRTIGITIGRKKQLKVSWLLFSKRLLVHRGDLKNLSDEQIYDIPYIEPDFTNYSKLVSKLKTYIIFS
jgi:hypothetical protein